MECDVGGYERHFFELHKWMGGWDNFYSILFHLILIVLRGSCVHVVHLVSSRFGLSSMSSDDESE